MGASLSTIHAQLHERFAPEQQQRGYCTVGELATQQPICGISPCHLGIMWLVDRDRDGRFTLEDLLAFASFADTHARVHRTTPPGFLLSGYAALRLWAALQDHAGQQQFVDWCMRLFTVGYERPPLRQQPQRGRHAAGQQQHHHQQQQPAVVQQRAVRALHAVFAVERNHGMTYDELLSLLRCVGEEEQLLSVRDASEARLVAVCALRHFVEAVSEGLRSALEHEADVMAEVLARTDAALCSAECAKQQQQQPQQAWCTPPPPPAALHNKQLQALLRTR